MKLSPDNLPNDVDLLKQLLLETLAAKDNVIVLKDAEIAALKYPVQRLLEQFRLAQQQPSAPAVKAMIIKVSCLTKLKSRLISPLN